MGIVDVMLIDIVCRGIVMCHLSTLFKHLCIYTLFMLLIGATGDVSVMCFIRVFYQSLINVLM